MCCTIRCSLQVVVSSLRLSNVPVRCASAGQTVTFKLTECASDADAHLFSGSLACGAGQCGRRRSSATGLVLLSPPSADATAQQQQQHVNVPSSSIITQRQQEQENQQEVPLAHWEFEAELLVLNHPAKIRVNYEPVVHVGCVKQSAKLISIRKIIIPGEGGTHSSHEEGEMSSIGGNVGEIGNDEVGNGERAVCR